MIWIYYLNRFLYVLIFLLIIVTFVAAIVGIIRSERKTASVLLTATAFFFLTTYFFDFMGRYIPYARYAGFLFRFLAFGFLTATAIVYAIQAQRL